MSSSHPRSSRTNYKLSDEHKEWLGDYYPSFKSHIAPRGTTRRPNAKAWVVGTLAPVFITEFHPSLAGAERDEKMIKVADSIYVYYSNQWKLDPSRDRGDGEEQIRISAENLWAKANPNIVNEALVEHAKEHPDLAGLVGTHRSVVCQFFKALPADEQAQWQTQAQTEREMQALAAKEELTGDAKKLFSDRFLVRVFKLLKEGEVKAGIHSYAHIATEKEKIIELEGDQADGVTLLINSVLSPGMTGFKDTTEYRDAANQFGEYIRENLNKPVVDQAPPVAVVPSKDGFPEVPTNYSEQSLRDVRAMVRTSIGANWQIAGGNGAVAWTEIAKSIEEGLDDWVEVDRMPKDARFIDPGDMTIDECRSWLSHLSLRQTEGSDESTHFQFRQVYTCARHEFPEYTEVIGREKARRSNSDVHLVRLRGYYRKPNTFGAIKYPESTWRYVRYLRSLTRLAPTPVIDKQETSIYLNWFRGLETDDAEVFNLIRAIITSVNKLERYAPLNAETELWTDPDGKSLKVPLAIPQSPPIEKDIEVFTQRFWAHRSLFGLLEGFEEGEFGFFCRWQELQRTGTLYDPVTKTFRGGKLGIAWPMRGLLKVTANIGATLGKIEPPKEAPADYNLGGPRQEDWKTCVKMLGEWRELLDKAVSNLSVILPDKSRLSALVTLPKAEAPKPRKRKAKNVKHGGVKDSDIEDSDGKRSTVSSSKRRKKDQSTDLLLVPHRESVDFTTRLSIFGPRPPLSPVQRFDGSLQELLLELSGFNSRCKKYITCYNDAGAAAGDLYDATLLYQVRARIHDKDSEVRPLFESVLKQRGGWLKAESLWPKVESLFREGRQTLQEGVVLQRAIETNTVERESPAVRRIKQQLPELLACCWAVKCIVRRFSRLYSLSVFWANHLKDAWESIPMTAGTADLILLVAGIRDWQQDCHRVLRHCIEEEQEVWEEYEMKRHGVPDLVECWYTFGCPTDGALSPVAIGRVQDVLKSISFIEEDSEQQDAAPSSGADTSIDKAMESSQVSKESTSAADSARSQTLGSAVEKDVPTSERTRLTPDEDVTGKDAAPSEAGISVGNPCDKSDSHEVPLISSSESLTTKVQPRDSCNEAPALDSQDNRHMDTPSPEPQPVTPATQITPTSGQPPLKPTVSLEKASNPGGNGAMQDNTTDCKGRDGDGDRDGAGVGELSREQEGRWTGRN
ncbi:hypothetical protein RSOL_241260, partial [Rhizoctonia solani AG-3 Rhs1AP]